MGKKKKLSGHIMKKSIHKVAVNKFELKINRQKNNVLGQRPTKHDRGMPGVSKSKSIKKRMETLLVDYQKSKRVNYFQDKRLGTKGISEEEQALNRFKQKHKRQKLFNLNEKEEEGQDDDDAEVMTHGGTKISQFTTFDAPVPSDDDSDPDIDEETLKNKEKALASMYTTENFGGGVLSLLKDEDGKEVSHKDRLAELVFQSIVEKNQRRKEKNELQEKIESLNDKMKSVLPQLKAHVNRGDAPRGKVDSLDVAVRMLGMMPRGMPSERVKSKEEAEREEEERINLEEEERLERMKASSKKRQLEHISADAHGDEAWLDASKKTKYKDEDEDDEADYDDETDEEDEEADEDEDERVDEDEDERADEDEDERADEDEDERADEDEDGGVEDEAESKDAEEDKSAEETKDKKEGRTQSLSQQGGGQMRAFVESVKDKSPFLAAVAQLDKTDVTTLMHLLRTQQAQGAKVWDSVDDFCKLLWRAARKEPVQVANAFRHFLFDVQADYQVRCDEKNYGSFPSNAFIYTMFHLIPSIFPTSDYHHPVCTPFFITISHFLAMSSVSSSFDVAAGLHLCNILFTCCLDDKRWMPEAGNFLHACLLLHSSLPLHYKKLHKRVKIKDFTFLTPSQTHRKYENKFRVRDMFDGKRNSFLLSDEFKMESLALTLKSLCNFMLLHASSPSFSALFQHHVHVMATISMHKYPPEIKDFCNEIQQRYKEGSSQALKPLRTEKPRPKGINFLEPVLADKFGNKKKNAQTRDYEERKRVARKEKRKSKDDLRKMRKDQAFLNEHLLSEKIFRNKQREEKTRRILNDLAQQEGWYKEANKKRNTGVVFDGKKQKEKIQKL